jgi:peptide/bleomycin uptake transporter
MFASFFPNPRLFFPSAVLWTVICMLIWYFFARDLGPNISLGWIFGIGYPPPLPADAPEASEAGSPRSMTVTRRPARASS